MNSITKILIALIFALTSLASFSGELKGKVIRVSDGDSVTLLTSDNQTHRIRMSGIDAPEKKQPFSNRSRQALAELIDGKIVTVTYNKLDRYQRVIGKILYKGQDANLRQIELGLAWHYKEYEREQDVAERSTYANAEYLAKRDKLGVWSEVNPMPPWEYRKQKRSSN